MPQPVKVSDALLFEARMTSEVMERSIAGQIEWWARLGKSVESLMGGQHALALRRAGELRSLADAVREIGTPDGRQRLAAYLESRQAPYFLPHPTLSDAVLRVNEDGTREAGRISDRVFVPLTTKSTRASKRVIKATSAKTNRKSTQSAVA